MIKRIFILLVAFGMISNLQISSCYSSEHYVSFKNILKSIQNIPAECWSKIQLGFENVKNYFQKAPSAIDIRYSLMFACKAPKGLFPSKDIFCYKRFPTLSWLEQFEKKFPWEKNYKNNEYHQNFFKR
ncbi:MAG: hypothetical protein ACTSXG_00125 [Alphaproteobacteria bacterium]